MERRPQPNPEDPRVREFGLIQLRHRLSQINPGNIDVRVEMAKLHETDPEADLIIRSLVERFYPGHLDIQKKEHMTKLLIAAFKVRDSEESDEQEQYLLQMLAELDEMTGDSQ